jgi:uncharacterized protein YndB with AHSA1/START domain
MDPCLSGEPVGNLPDAGRLGGTTNRRSEQGETVGVTDVEQDPDSLRLVITGAWAAPPERVWALWADPRQLERWWGPPGYPATFTDHDLRPGGRASYHMTGPDGATYPGWWDVLTVDAPHHLEIRDGFADDGGAPSEELPVSTMVVTLTELPDGGTRMAIETLFASAENMDQIIEMGVVDGMTAAMGQIDELLAV